MMRFLVVLILLGACGSDETQDVLLLLNRPSGEIELFLQVCEESMELDCSDNSKVFVAGTSNLERSVGITIADSFASASLRLVLQTTGASNSRCDSTLVDLEKIPVTTEIELGDGTTVTTFACFATGECSSPESCEAQL